MRILPQFVRFAPHPLRPRLSDFRPSRLLLRGILLAFGCYAVYRGEQFGKAYAARWAAEMEAYKEKLRRESEVRIKEYNERADEEMAQIYRGINTVASYAGLDPIGDES